MTAPDPPVTERERRPLIDDDGRELLRSLLEHSAAPRYNHVCGDRITADKLAWLRRFDTKVRTTPPFTAGQPPGWVSPYVTRCLSHVPLYRRVGAAPARFEELPTWDRTDLIEAVHDVVPDDHPLDDLALFATTGTSDGREALIPSTPVAAAAYGSLLREALVRHGRELVGGRGRVAVTQVCWQRATYTYASISSFFDQAALVKLNLNLDDWRHPDDIATFLDDTAAEVYTGDPVAFAKLADVATNHRPTAMLSSAMTLLPGLADRLEARFGSPVIDVYGMNEAGPIAAALPDRSGHRPLQPELYIEILADDDRPCPPGETGEITLTGGFNSALPLLRYRTGDRAAIEMRGTTPVLVGLEGRAPVPLAAADGRALNTIDVRSALGRLPLSRYTLHQRRDLTLRIGIADGAATGAVTATEVAEALRPIFGSVAIEVHRIDDEAEGITYHSDLPIVDP